MKRQWLITALLLVAALNIYLLAFIGKQDQGTRDSLTDLSPDEIEQIEIRRGSERIVFRRMGGEWQLTEPLAGPAHPERITELRALAILQPLASYPTQEVDEERYGVLDPEITVVINNRLIAFGRLNEANGRRYVLVEDRLLLISNTVYPILNLPVERFLANDGT